MKTVISNVIEKPISGEWGNDGGNIKVLRSTNFTNEGYLNLNEVVTRDIDHRKVESKKLIPGDIIIEKSGGSPNQPVGRVVYFDEVDTYLCNNFTSILRPKTNKIYPKYLHYILFCNHKLGGTNSFQNKTTGIINLQLNRYIEEIQIPLPPLPTQKKIASILDAADAYRQKTRTLIEKYDQLAQSLFMDMFGDPVRNEKGWEMVKIEKLCTEIVDCVNKTAPSVDYKTDYKMIRTTNVRNYKVCLEDVRYVEKDIFEKWNRRLVPKQGDIVFTREAPMGEAGIICCNEKVFLGQRTMLFRTDDKFSNKYYLLFQLMGKGIEKQIEKLSMGSTVKHLTVPACNEFELPKPPLSLQNQFAERAQLIEAQKQQAQASLQKAEDLFNSLLQRAFKGELG